MKKHTAPATLDFWAHAFDAAIVPVGYFGSEAKRERAIAMYASMAAGSLPWGRQ